MWKNATEAIFRSVTFNIFAINKQQHLSTIKKKILMLKNVLLLLLLTTRTMKLKLKHRKITLFGKLKNILIIGQQQKQLTRLPTTNIWNQPFNIKCK